MKTFALPFAVLLALAGSAAQAQVHVGIELGLPEVPNLVVVSPGIQVVEGFGDEVFLQGGWYWCRRSDGWYRSRSPRSHFDWVDRGRVPGGLSRMPAGRYQNWHHGESDHAMGGHAMGGHDMGGHAMGGHDMGGHAMGGPGHAEPARHQQAAPGRAMPEARHAEAAPAHHQEAGHQGGHEGGHEAGHEGGHEGGHH